MTQTLAQDDTLNVIPEIELGTWIADIFDWLELNLATFWSFLETVFGTLFDNLSEFLQWPPPLVLIVLLAALAWFLRGWRVGVGSLLGLALIRSVGVWDPAMETLALILIATIIALVFAIPIGILAAQVDAVSTAVRPVLDFMQTLHPFVYLPIMVGLFGLGAESGIAATIIFASPPGIRLTELGIRQVDTEMVEAGEAFGASRRQVLGRIQLPLALSSIMAGVNQVIMLSLSMVVLAALVGAPGLGQLIVNALSTLDLPKAFEAGIGLAVIAMFLDRTSGAIGLRSSLKGQMPGVGAT